jgi:tetratricopeptide (TPR) repeat protein
LEKAGMRELLARVQDRMAQLNPLNEKNILGLARTLRQLGRMPEARAWLDRLALRAALNEDSLGPVAQGFADLGDTERALALYAQAARSDRFARNWETLLQYARLQMQKGDLAGAKTTLRCAFTHPANREFVVIIEWLVAAGKLAQADAEASNFQLTLLREAELRKALFGYFEKAGQPGNALALLEKHPEIADPPFAPRVRTAAVAAKAFDRGLAVLDKLASQAEAPEAYAVELARLQGEWAQSELAAGDATAALAHWRLAHERRPELFEIAAPLSSLQAQQGDRKSAIETLQSYLAVGKVPAELERARAQLAKLKGS